MTPSGLATTILVLALESTLLNRVTDAYPSYSHDGEVVAYMSNADGDFDIYLVEPRAS